MKIIKFLEKESKAAKATILFMAILSGLANGILLVIINVVAEKVSNHQLQFHYFFLYLTAFALYLYTLRYIFYETIIAIERAIYVVQLRIDDKIRRCGLRKVENKTTHEMQAQLSQESHLISQSALIIFLAMQSAIILFFSGIYLLWLSPWSFFITIIWLIVAVFIYFFIMERINLKENNRLVPVENISESKYSQIILLGRQITTTILFSQMIFYLLLAILVFIMPLFNASHANIIFKITAIALFIIGPLGMLVAAYPTVSRANVAVANLYQLEAQLDIALTHPVPQQTNLLPATKFKIQMENATFHSISKAGEPPFFSANLINLIITQQRIFPYLSQLKTNDSTTSLSQASFQMMEKALEERVARSVKADDTLKNYVLVSVTIGLVPVPLVDMAALIAIQLRLTHHLAQQYQVLYSSSLANSLILSLLGSLVTTTSTMPLASVIKTIPFMGSIAGSVSVAILGGATTYAVGKVFIQHFESGGTFLDFKPEKVKEHFKSFFEEGKRFAAMQQQVKNANS
jgi:uncharacterized protein (DUF697 family)